MKRIFSIILFFISIQTMAQLKSIPSGAYHWSEAPAKKSGDREGRRFVEGTSPQFEYFEIHATTQEKGAAPRPPHAQKDIEELLIVKEGKMKFTINNESRVLGKGSIVLVAPQDMQSIENVGDGSLSYYVFMFRSNKPMDMARSIKAGGSLLLDADTLTYVPSARGGGIKYFDRPTAMCENFEMHITELKSKGPSHAPHQHIDTEIILIIEGDTEITIDGKNYKASAGDFYIMNSGEMHGVSNSLDAKCSYFAFKWR
ncbi:MAG: cupin domain-containing protein [Bacteroidota bacterium]